MAKHTRDTVLFQVAYNRLTCENAPMSYDILSKIDISKVNINDVIIQACKEFKPKFIKNVINDPRYKFSPVFNNKNACQYIVQICDTKTVTQFLNDPNVELPCYIDPIPMYSEYPKYRKSLYAHPEIFKWFPQKENIILFFNDKFLTKDVKQEIIHKFMFLITS